MKSTYITGRKRERKEKDSNKANLLSSKARAVISWLGDKSCSLPLYRFSLLFSFPYMLQPRPYKLHTLMRKRTWCAYKILPNSSSFQAVKEGEEPTSVVRRCFFPSQVPKAVCLQCAQSSAHTQYCLDGWGSQLG